MPKLKSDNPFGVNKYRSVSLLYEFSKAFQIVIYTQVMFHFKQQLAEVQHEFVKGRSVETNLSSFLNYAAWNLFAGGQADVIK